jgi:hypothetical protein
MPARALSRVSVRALVLVGLVVVTGCLPLPTESTSPSPSPTPTPRPTATPTLEPSVTPAPTPRPNALTLPSERDDRQLRVTVAPNLPTDGSGQIVVTVTNLSTTRIQEIVLRWPTSLDANLFLAPFTPSPDRNCNGCPPLVQPWTKWVVGPGERGEPAGTTSLGWGPLDAGATLTIPIVATRRINGPVEFDLQLLAGEALLRLETDQPAWLRVSVP